MDPDPKIVGTQRALELSEPAKTAAQWVARRDAGLGPDERRQLHAWLSASPLNAAAFAAADKSATELDWPMYLGAEDEVIAGLAMRARRRKRRRIVASASTATALALAGILFIQTPRAIDTDTFDPTKLVVKTPEQTILPDGSIVDLKDGARYTSDFSDQLRSITLLRGTAHFKVAKNSRPFVVNAAGVRAEALGTEFSVEFEGPSVSVLVTEGRVSVNIESGITLVAPAVRSRLEPLVILDAGNAVNVSLATPSSPLAFPVQVLPLKELEDRLAWRIPRLEFSGTPLIDVVAMINRHNTQQLIIADRSLENLELSGVVRADKVDALLELLESEFRVTSERGEETISLRAAR